jgi:hypothetical protein
MERWWLDCDDSNSFYLAFSFLLVSFHHFLARARPVIYFHSLDPFSAALHPFCSLPFASALQDAHSVLLFANKASTIRLRTLNNARCTETI